MFPDIAYLDWMAGRPEAAEYDLGSSDLRRASARGEGVVPPRLADEPTPDASVETLLAERYGVDPENVLVTAGASHANFVAFATALAEAGDEGATGPEGEAVEGSRILVEKPGYEPLVATPRGLGATVDRFRRRAEDGYEVDPDRAAAAVVEDTVLVAMTNCHNPGGRRADNDRLAATARAVADAGARLLVDEVYAPFGTDAGSGPLGGPSVAGLSNAVVTNSVTKFLGFPGLRIGWLVADAGFVERARSVERHLPAASEPGRRLARRALGAAAGLGSESRERVRANHRALAEFVAGRSDLSGTAEDGCPYAFLDHATADGDEVAAAAWADGVLVVPGRFFDDADRFRVAACGDPEAVTAGLARLGEVLDGIEG